MKKIYSLLLLIPLVFIGKNLLGQTQCSAPVTSGNGTFTVTTCANYTTVSPGGTVVTYTYKVKNISSGTLYFDSYSETKVSSLTYVSGLNLNGQCNTQSLAAGDEAVFTGTLNVTQTTTNTATFYFGTQLPLICFGLGIPRSVSSAAASTTVTVVLPPGAKGCNTIFYSSDVVGSLDGRVGTVNVTTAATSSSYDVSQINTSYNGAAALAVDPADPSKIYFIPRNGVTSSASYGALTRIDAAANTAGIPTSTPATTAANTPDGNRLSVAPDQSVWTIFNGSAYKWTPAAGWVNKGTVTLSTGESWSNYPSGDIAFDGDGTMFVLISNTTVSPIGDSKLFTITQAELNDGAPAASLVGKMADGKAFTGIAFDENGTLYASSADLTNGGWTLYSVNIASGQTTTIASSTTQAVTDLASCALPQAELQARKTVSPAGKIGPNTTLTYTIVVKNVGTLPSTGTTLLDLVPANTTLVTNSTTLNGSSHVAYTTAQEIHSAGNLNGVISQGQTATIEFKVLTSSTFVGEICNQGEVNYTGNTTLLTDEPTLPGGTDKTCVEQALKYTVAGNVFNDPNGANVNNSSGATNLVPAGIYANLVDGSGAVVATATVNTDGTYTFPAVFPGNDFKVVISTTQGTLNSPPPAVVLPSDWTSTGEFNGTPNTGTDATVDGISQPFNITNANVTNINFGIKGPDCDGDGVGNAQDLDDDNDGILDTVERQCNTGFLMDYSTQPAGQDLNGKTLNSSIPGLSIAHSITGAFNLWKGPETASQPYSIYRVSANTQPGIMVYDFSQPIQNLIFSVRDLDFIPQGTSEVSKVVATYKGVVVAPTAVTLGANVRVSTYGAGYYEGTNDNTNTTSYANGVIYNFGANPVDKLTVYGAHSGNNNSTQGSLHLLEAGCLLDDLDQDGIPNTCDLDSDGDGCPDAIEGGSTAITGSNLVTSTMNGGNNGTSYNGSSSLSITQNLGNTVSSTAATLGVPTIAGTGQSVGNSQNKNVNDCSQPVSGNVFNDLNGGNVDGAGINPGGLNANLLNSSGVVVATVPVGSDGKYNFTNVNPGTYTVQISTIAGTPTQPAPAQTLPAGWVNTGDFNGAPNTGTNPSSINGVSEPFTVLTSPISDINFGITPPPPPPPISCSGTALPCIIDWDSPTTQTATKYTYTVACNGRTITVELSKLSGAINLNKINGTDGNLGLQGAWLGSNSSSAVGVGEDYSVVFKEAGNPVKVVNANLGFWAINDNCDGNEDLVNFSTNGTATNLVWTGEAGAENSSGNCGANDGGNAPIYVGGAVTGFLNTPTSATNNVGPGTCCNDGGYMNFSDATGFTQILFRRQIESLRTNTNLTANGFTSGYTNGVVLGGDNFDKSTSQFCLLPSPQPVSGNVFNDLNRGNVDGAGVNPGSLNANLLNSSGVVVATVPVGTDGKYNFTNVNSGTYSVQISTIAGTPTQPAPAQNLPAGWVNTGDFNGAPNTGTNPSSINGASEPFTVLDSPVIDINFGIVKLLKLSGSVFNDTNGGTVNGTGTDAGGLNANLIGSDGKVVATVPVNANGTYEITNVYPGTYTVQISTVAGTTGQAAPAQTLSNGWANTGDTNTGAGPNSPDGVSEPIVVANVDVANINFGVQQPPTPTSKTLAVQVNPGGTIPVSVTNEFAATDVAPGSVTAIKITSFPTNVTSIIINGTTYTASTFPSSGVTVPTNSSGVPTQSISIDPIDGAVTAVIPFKAIDNAGSESTTTGNITVPFRTIKVTGNVLNDTDGATDGQVDGTGIGNAGGPLTVSLMSGSSVIATVPVNADGSYTFNNVSPGSYTVKLSTLAPASNYVNTGENNGTGPGVDPTVDGQSLPFTVASADVTDINLGIQQLPSANTVTLPAEVNPGGTTTKNITTSFGGTDPDGGTISKIKITSMPANLTSIKIGSVTYGPNDTPFPAGGVEVPTNASGVPTVPILIDPIDGSVAVSVPYVTIDNAGFVSPTPGAVNITFSSLKIEGNVYNDANGATDGQVNGTPTNASGTLTATLKNGTSVVATVPVGADGKYVFNNVFPGNYTVEISALPTNYVNTGENNGAGPGIDGTVNGKSEPFTVSNASVDNINFGIEQLPTANTANLPTEINPGGTITKNVTNNFGGTDPDGVISKIKITSMPTNATSIKIGAVTYGPNNTPFPPGGVEVPTTAAGVPTEAILVDPVDGNVTVNIPYVTIDNADKPSPTAGSVSIPFSTVSISGNVFNDVNGLNPTPANTVDGTGTNTGGTLTVLLKNGATTVATATVNADGTYTFPNVAPGTYTTELGPLPANWVNTGDNNGAGVGSGATVDGKSEPFNVSTSNVTNINFGIEQLPTANTASTSPEINPGGTTTKNVTNNFGGTDPDGGIISSIKITSMPTYATTIKIGTTTYGPGATPFPAGGVTVPTDATGKPTVAILVDPVDGAVTVNIPYKTIDNAGKESSNTGAVNVPFLNLSVEGNVFNDVNGLNPTPTNTVDGTPTNAGGLFANLLNSAGTQVVASVPVNPDGTYKFENVTPGAYVVQINKTAGVPNTAPPAAGLPTGWKSTGENNGPTTASGSDGTVDGKSAPFSVSTTNVKEINFGIQQPPTANTATKTIAQNPGGTNSSPTVSDQFGGTDPSGGVIKAIKITSFPTTATSITIGGTPYTTLAAIQAAYPNGIPTNDNGVPTVPILIDPIDGNTTVSIPYKTVDNAGQESENTGVANIPFFSVNVEGNVFNDINGLNPTPANTVDGSPTNAGGLFANLLGADGITVIASVPVGPDGKYKFTNVTPGTLTVQINKTAGTPSQPAPPQELPMGWVSTGENNGPTTAPGSDGTINGKSAPITLTNAADVTNVNFGIQQPPTANTTSLAAVANPGGTNPSVELNDKFGGTDPAGGTIKAIKITSFPTNTTSIIIDGVPYTTITAIQAAYPNGILTDATGKPTVSIKVDPVDGTVAVNIPYKTIDDAGSESATPGSVTVNFINVKVSGTVFLDPDSMTDNQIDGTPFVSSPVVAVLVDKDGKVVATKTINSTDGTYVFENVPSGSYTVQINTTAPTVGDPAPAPSFPPTYGPTAEGTVITGDGNPDGKTPVTVATTDVTNVNFGLQKPPIAENDEKLANPPGVVVVPSVLGNDKTADGTPALPNEVDIDLDPDTPGIQPTVSVIGEGEYVCDPFTGIITFTPEPGFTGDPAPIPYTITEKATGLKDGATIKIDYIPVASNDTKNIPDVTQPTTIDPTTNDTGGDTVDPTTVKLIDPVTGNPTTTVTVSGQGTWTVNPSTGGVTFTPTPGFTSSPTPVKYQVADEEGNTSTATIKLVAPPLANNDEKLANPPGNVTVPNILGNDKKENGSVPTTSEVQVDLDPSTPAIDNEKTVPGEGKWTYNPDGTVTFAPEPTFKLDPTPIPYTIKETTTGLTSPPATIKVDYVPIATDDTKSIPNPAQPTTVDPLANDTGGDKVDPTSVKLIDPTSGNPTTTVTVSGQGTWSVNPTTGGITFTPTPGFTSSPTPINYKVSDDEGNTTSAKVTLTVSGALSVNLIEFKANSTSENVNLIWKVANEINFSHYEILSGIKNNEMKALGKVKGNSLSNYSYLDKKASEGINYYQLRMVDIDGTTKLSKIVSVRFEKGLAYVNFVNPAEKGVIDVTTNMANASFTLRSATGAKLPVNAVKVAEGQYKLIVANYTAGILYLTTESKGKTVTRKVMMR